MGRKSDISPYHQIEDKDVFFDTQSVTPTNANNSRNFNSSEQDQELDDISDLVESQGIIQNSSLGGFLGGIASMKKNVEKEKLKQERESKMMAANIKDQTIKEEASYQSEDDSDDSSDSDDSHDDVIPDKINV